jgi:DNA-binding MarR family transcriptional regulator
MPAIASVRYTHDAIIDTILENPGVSQGDLSRMFGYTQSWMSIIINSDAFQERLAERKGELVDPRITASLEERAESVARLALDRLMDEIERPGPKKIQDLVAAAKIGLGDRMVKNPSVQNNNLYVVALPPPAETTSAWMEKAQGRPKIDVVDISFSNPEP